MEAQADIHLRASMAPTWLACSSRATFETLRAGQAGESVGVATEFGTRVHAAITGQAHEPPGSVVYDEHTATARELTRQVNESIAAIGAALDLGKIVRREADLRARIVMSPATVLVTGHIDLVMAVPGIEGVVDIIDLKTGRMDQRSALVQMAIYAWLAEQNGWGVRDVVVLHVPRAVDDPAAGWSQKVQVLRRPAEALIVEAEAAIRLVALAGRSPVAVPGIQCGWCENVGCVYHGEND